MPALSVLRFFAHRLQRSRLAQFVLIGTALYGVDAARARSSSSATAPSKHVEIDPAVLEELKASQAKKLGVPSLPEDGSREVEARAIEDEILYREALRLKLDQDDPIIRQRLVQKLLLLVEDMGGASRDPTRAELRAYYDLTRDRWRKPETWHFVHVFARSPDALPQSSAITSADTAARLGEAFAYPREMTLGRDGIERLFGASFAREATALAPGVASEPLRSPYGWHRVLVLEHVAGAPASFEEAEREITLDFMLDRRERVVGGYLVDTASTYDVNIGSTHIAHFVPTRRVAARTEGSAED